MAVAPGCATDTDEPDPKGPMTPVTPDDPNPAKPLQAEGTYVLDSAFNLEGSLAHEGVGGALVEIVDTFDGATDPVAKLLDVIADKLGSAEGSKFREFLQKIELAAVAGLNAKFPEEWKTVTNFGKSVVGAVRRFGIRGKLELASRTAGGEVKAKLTVYALTLRIEGEAEARELLLADAGVADIVVNDVPLTVDASGNVTIGEHSFGVSFGDLADVAIQQVIIPALDPSLANEPGDRLAPFLSKLVRCTDPEGQTLGQLVVDSLGEEYDWAGAIGTFIDTGCSTAVSWVVQVIDEKLAEKTEGALSFKVRGSARLVDENNDGTADRLAAGAWTGEVTIAGTVAPLMGDQSFLGHR
jgi:hypothetical protein